MALPGLGGFALPGLDSGLLSAQDQLLQGQQNKPSTATAARVHTLPPQSEYRFETATDLDAADAGPLRLTLQSGAAELFGTELAPGTTYEFRGAAKAAVFTWRGCALRVEGPAGGEYVAAAPGAAAQCAGVHFALEEARAAARASAGAGRGPRVLVVGAEGAGKTSLCRTLAAYALRAGRVPVAANLDAREGMLGVPGALSGAALASLLDVRDGWGGSPVSGASAVPVKRPLCYHFGCRDPEENPRLFKALVSRLGAAVLARMDGDPETGSSGCVVDTPGSLSSGRPVGYEIIEHTVMAFSGL
jgi:polyribonucleotide 5'-hydroxyl-kinase